MNVSVVISTRNRADSLEKTLVALAQVEVPPDWKAELIVVDNGSSDHTRAVVKRASHPSMPIHYLHEPVAGTSRARNAGFALSQGQVILITDDDVRPVRNWLEMLARPLLDRKCDGVVGKIELASDLIRPWMTPMHRLWLAAPIELCNGGPDLIGANMGIHRMVLDHVPGFDVKMGPGALGFAEDNLFSWQIREAGLRVSYVPEALVVHHPDASRLLREKWLASARLRGRAEAYLFHHWKHEEMKNLQLQSWYLAAKLYLRRLAQSPPAIDEEGAPPWELSYVYQLETRRHLLEERKRAREFNKRGLRKGPALSQSSSELNKRAA